MPHDKKHYYNFGILEYDAWLVKLEANGFNCALAPNKESLCTVSELSEIFKLP